MPKVPGLVKGLGVTLGTLFNTATKGSNTVQYPHEKETPPIRSRGVIATPGQLHFMHAVFAFVP